MTYSDGSDRRPGSVEYPYGDGDAVLDYPITRKPDRQHQSPQCPPAYYVPVPYYPAYNPWQAARDPEDASRIAKIIWVLIIVLVIAGVIGFLALVIR